MNPGSAKEDSKKPNESVVDIVHNSAGEVQSPHPLAHLMKMNGIATMAQNLVKDKLFTRYIQSTESDTSFHFSFFLEAFIIHLLYNLTLGPLMLLIFTPIFGWTLMRNMQFVVNIPMYAQGLLWLTNSTTLILYILYGYSEILEYYTMQLFFIIVRSIVISLRYGYSSVELMSLYHTTDIVSGNGRGISEILVNGWLSPLPSDLSTEIKSAMWRHHIDGQEFFVRFRDKLPNILHDKLTVPDYYLKYDYNFAEDIKIAANIAQGQPHAPSPLVANSHTHSNSSISSLHFILSFAC